MNSIIITGAGSGLGKELALLYGQKGYHIILAGRKIEKLKPVEEQITSQKGKATSLPVDVTVPSEIKLLMADVSSRFNLYGLINNAGLGMFGPFEQSTPEKIEQMFEVNVFGTIHMTQAFLQEVKEGFIMNIISTAGLIGKTNEAGYCASKFAVRGLTESLQKEYEASNIQVKAVYMGGMDTPFWDHSDHIKDKSRLQSPAKIAEIIWENMDKDTIIIENNKP
ncbi:SDR family oxidoreductase [Bacillus sp. DTU_2020_1000418_1_SI_GHA_SEK_038]|uniref:SDR family NAD(P)-dependent oxidoreductase n=1 Tax=Bacillus sp. DTU_2020_1000418_1_SI_GHA_SEK_038 TaxID=3077585 RepID=UPI0028E5FFB8|nr:SDR family oxidoreductase [Bacillus sp. DTU_2020_1000418_1_SI_GHA_SEK_038]WNS76631.1 SDR family oxidoreductase [Bacillus sp. DTU_2020_1000418_1_SI_GHA_SEK_038]